MGDYGFEGAGDFGGTDENFNCMPDGVKAQPYSHTAAQKLEKESSPVRMRLEVRYLAVSEKDTSPMINIDGDEISYSRILNMYIVDGKSTYGHGLQIEREIDETKAQILCRKIADAVQEYFGK